METIKTKIFAVIAKFDNGTHSSNQLQGADEELLKIFEDGIQAHNQKIFGILEQIKESDEYGRDVVCIKTFKENLNQKNNDVHSF